ncbi:MAG TPA: sugar ABC transporter permease [Ktedonobacteraceae bacterium]|jgi:ABC-type sugar transport system permease subunit|nr:sugar ABC transporter permease [Ktedonobacteraceae bacterium]
MSVTPLTKETSNQTLKTPLPRRKWARVDTLPYLLLVPSLILIAVIEIYPFLTGVYYSLQNGTLLIPGTFVGLQNYVSAFVDPEFQHAVTFSALFAVCGVVGSYLLGLGLALFLVNDFPLRGLYRVLLILPWILSSIVTIVSWRWMIQDQHGTINVLLSWFHLGPIYFLSDPKWAVVAVIVIKIWRSFPFMMISLIAALQTIDGNLYEAARIDGADRWAAFRNVTFPGIRNISIVLWILMTIWSVNDFETPWLLNQGGPSNATESLMILAYRDTFARNFVGTGAAVAFISLIILMILAILMMRLRNKE